MLSLVVGRRKWNPVPSPLWLCVSLLLIKKPKQGKVLPERTALTASSRPIWWDSGNVQISCRAFLPLTSLPCHSFTLEEFYSNVWIMTISRTKSPVLSSGKHASGRSQCSWWLVGSRHPKTWTPRSQTWGHGLGRSTNNRRVHSFWLQKASNCWHICSIFASAPHRNLFVLL